MESCYQLFFGGGGGGLVCFAQHNYFEIYPCCGYQSFIHLNCSVVSIYIKAYMTVTTEQAARGDPAGRQASEGQPND